MLERLVAVEVDVLVCVSRFSVYVEGEASSRFLDDCHTHDRDFAVRLFFFCPLDAGMSAVEKVVDRLHMIATDGRYGIVSLTRLKLDGVVSGW
jgi:hypothetical protein